LLLQFRKIFYFSIIRFQWSRFKLFSRALVR